MATKDTPTRPQTSTRTTSLAAARKILDVTPNEGDQNAARQLLALHSNKHTPPMIKHLIFNLFWDVCQYYRIALPNNFPSKWRGYWPLVIAKLRATGHMPATASYTWQPDEEEEAQLDAEEKEERDTRAIFDLLHHGSLPVDTRNRLFDDVIEILDRAHPHRVAARPRRAR